MIEAAGEPALLQQFPIELPAGDTVALFVVYGMTGPPGDDPDCLEHLNEPHSYSSVLRVVCHEVDV
jgi:hypothetical protein